MNIGNALKQLRKAKGLTQAEVAEAAGITQTALSNIENDTRPGIETMERLCIALDVPQIYVLIGAMEKEEISPHKQELYDILFPVIIDLLKKLL